MQRSSEQPASFQPSSSSPLPEVVAEVSDFAETVTRS